MSRTTKYGHILRDMCCLIVNQQPKNRINKPAKFSPPKYLQIYSEFQLPNLVLQELNYYKYFAWHVLLLITFLSYTSSLKKINFSIMLPSEHDCLFFAFFASFNNTIWCIHRLINVQSMSEWVSFQSFVNVLTSQYDSFIAW